MAAPEVKIVAPSQYDVSQKVTTSPLYTYYDVFPEDGARSDSFLGNSVLVKTFQIPAGRLINLARTVVHADIELGSATGTNPGVVIKNHVLPIQNIRLMTRTGTDIVNISNVQDYHRIVCVPSIAREEALAESKCTWATALDYKTGNWRPHFNHYKLFSDGTSDGIQAINDGVSNATLNSVGAEVGTYDAYLDHGGFETIVKRHNDGTSLKAHLEIPLGQFVGTAFAYDKSIMFPEVLELRIEFAPSSSFAWRVDTATEANITGNAAALTTNETQDMTELRLALCHDQNKAATATWISKLQSDMPSNLTIPFTTMFNINILSGTQGQANIRLNRAHGSTLLRIMSAVRKASQSLAPGYCYYNMSDDNVAEYQTMLNSQPLQPKNLDTSKNHDWEFNNQFLKGSIIWDPISYKAFMPVHIDQFGSDGEPLVNAKVSDFYRSGMPLDTELTYTRHDRVKAAAAQNALIAVVAQKTLSLSRNGIAVV